MEWLTLSKAADKSSKMSDVNLRIKIHHKNDVIVDWMQ